MFSNLNLVHNQCFILSFFVDSQYLALDPVPTQTFALLPIFAALFLKILVPRRFIKLEKGMNYPVKKIPSKIGSKGRLR